VPGLDALVCEVREIRPEWSSRSIRRALAHPDVTERGWDRARRAMLAVAADPGSNQPGRLAHGGPWWSQPGAGQPRPPWCGACDEVTRMLGYDGDAPGPCPRCRPPATRRSPDASAADRCITASATCRQPPPSTSNC
jgi:hypothetical protein